MDIAALGYQIDSSQAVGAAKNLDAMNAAAARAEVGAKRIASASSGATGGVSSMTGAMSAAAGGSNRLANSMTNVSFQVQDFAVQVASGQSALTAFAQQFPQLTGALGFGGKAGLYGALIGTAAAVGVALYQALNDTGAAATAFKDQMEALEGQVSSFRDAAELAALPLDKLYEKFGSASPVLQQALSDLAGIEKVKAYDAINATAQSMVALVGYAGQWNAEANRINQSFLGFTVNSEQARVAAYNFNTELQRMASAQDPVEKLKSAINLRDQLDKATGGYSKMNAEQRTMREGLSKVIVQLEMMGVRVDGSADAMEKFRVNSAAAQGPISGLVGLTNSLADAAWRAAGGMAAYAQGQVDAASASVFGPDTVASVPSGLGNFGVNPLGQGLAPGRSPRPGTRPTLQNDPNWGWTDKEKGGGGGGGKSAAEELADDMEKRFEALQKGLASEYALKMQEYAKDGEAMKWALNNKKISQEQYNDEMELLRIATWGAEWELTSLKYQQDQEALQSALDQKLLTEEEYHRKRKELAWANLLSEENRSDLAQDLDNTSQYFGQLYSMTGSSLDGLLKLQRGFSAAMAVVNAWQGYTTVLADPTVPFWMKFAAAGKVLAAGLGAVNAIKGGGGSGGATGTTSATSSARAEPERVTRVELQGEDWLVSLAETMMTQIYEGTKNGRVIVARG